MGHSGVISAVGGNHTDNYPGGGGRIALYFNTSTIDGTVVAYGGYANGYRCGGPGTIFLFDLIQNKRTLISKGLPICSTLTRNSVIASIGNANFSFSSIELSRFIALVIADSVVG